MAQCVWGFRTDVLGLKSCSWEGWTNDGICLCVVHWLHAKGRIIDYFAPSSRSIFSHVAGSSTSTFLKTAPSSPILHTPRIERSNVQPEAWVLHTLLQIHKSRPVGLMLGNLSVPRGPWLKYCTYALYKFSEMALRFWGLGPTCGPHSESLQKVLARAQGRISPNLTVRETHCIFTVFYVLRFWLASMA